MADALEFRVRAIVDQAIQDLNRVNKAQGDMAKQTEKTGTALTKINGASASAGTAFRRLGGEFTQLSRSLGSGAGAVGELVGSIISMGPAIGAMALAIKGTIDMVKAFTEGMRDLAAGTLEARDAQYALAIGGDFLTKYLSTTNKELTDATVKILKEIGKRYGLDKEILEIIKESGTTSESLTKTMELLGKKGFDIKVLFQGFMRTFMGGNMKDIMDMQALIDRWKVLEGAAAQAPQTFEKINKGIEKIKTTSAGKVGKDYSSLYGVTPGAGLKGIRKPGVETIPDMKEAITNVANAGEVLSQFQVDLLYFRDALEEGIGAPLNDIFGDNFKTLLDDSFSFLQVKLDETDAGFKKFFGNVWNNILDLATKVVTSAFIQIAVNLVKMLIPGGTTVSWGSSILNAVLAGLGIGGFDNPANDDIARKFGKDFVQHLTNGMRGAMPKSGVGQGQPIVIQVTQPGLLRQSDFIVGSNPSEQRLFNRALRRVAEAGA